MSNKIMLIHQKPCHRSRPTADDRTCRSASPQGPPISPLFLCQFSITSQILAMPFIQVGFILGLRIDAPAYIYSPYPPPSAICHKSRSDQKLGFLERREQSSNSSSSRIGQLARFKYSLGYCSGSWICRLEAGISIVSLPIYDFMLLQYYVAVYTKIWEEEYRNSKLPGSCQQRNQLHKDRYQLIQI